MGTPEITTQELQICRIKFPEIKLQTRDAHKLRGYFGNLFKNHSSILHNHDKDGSFRYRYPIVQYKVIDKTPMLIGIGEGAELLPQLFLKIREIDIDGKKYPVHAKNIESETEEIGFSESLHSYKFETLWMALNQKNYPIYQNLESKTDKQNMLNRILVGHVLSFLSNMEVQLQPQERLMTKVEVQEKSTKFKNKRMLAFSGSFVINALLPNEIGLGKSVARGFGTVMGNEGMTQ